MEAAPAAEEAAIAEADFKRVGRAVIEAYFGKQKGRQLVKHQLDSYDDFVSRKLEQIVHGFNPIEVSHQFQPEQGCHRFRLSIVVQNPVLSKPTIFEKDGSTKTMMPNDARLRNLTYAAPLHVDLVVTARTWSPEAGEYAVETKRITSVSLGRLPVMVRSRYCMLSLQAVPSDADECRYDYGGYFIVNGNEKVVISQDRIAENRPFVFVNAKATTYSHVAEIRSVHEERCGGVPRTTALKLASKANQYGRVVHVAMHHVRHDVPLFVVFRALGVESDRDIVRHVVPDDAAPDAALLARELGACIDDASGVATTAAARDYLARYLQAPGAGGAAGCDALGKLLRQDFLPHAGAELGKKALYLGYMTRKLLRCFLGLQPFDDRDSYISKRGDAGGVLLGNLFRQAYGKTVKDMRSALQKEFNTGAWRSTSKCINVLGKSNVNKVCKPTSIESNLKYGLSTGNWGVKTGNKRQGVAQMHSRGVAYVGALSHLRRINTPIEKTGKLVQPRKLHSTQWGIICPAETPEGASVGLVKNLALLASITVATPSAPAREVLAGLGVRLWDAAAPPEARRPEALFTAGDARVFVNGDLVGSHARPAELHARLRDMKRAGVLSVFAGVAWSIAQNEVAVCTEGGRFVRPLLTVRGEREGGGLALRAAAAARVVGGRADWCELLLSGAVEYMDVEEANCAMVAMEYGDLLRPRGGARYTHLEIDPCAMLGVVAGSIPFAHHNQAPRNTYQCLDPDEPVLLADGSRARIGDVRRGDRVVTFDPATGRLAPSRVVHQYVRPSAKPMHEVVTAGGRAVRATCDHRFLALRPGLDAAPGWLPVGAFEPGRTLVAVHALGGGGGADSGPDGAGRPRGRPAPPLTAARLARAVDFVCGRADARAPRGYPTDAAAAAGALAALAPLLEAPADARERDATLAALARVAGCALGGGRTGELACAERCDLRLHSELDLEAFEADLERLGLPRGGEHTHLAASALAAALLDADADERGGAALPAWIADAAPAVAREFLAALLGTGPDGGDGRQPWPEVRSWRCGDGEAARASELGSALVALLQRAAGIEGATAAAAAGRLTLELPDPAALHAAVGVRYAHRRALEAAARCEYAGYVAHAGAAAAEPWPAWRAGLRTHGELLLVPLRSAAALGDGGGGGGDRLVADITVESDNHSFVGGRGGGFAVSNSAMGKQAIGVYATNFRHRYDTVAHVLNYPQRPLVSTHTSRIINCDELPCGINAVVAIACFTGFNQEDSVIMCRSGVDSGMLSSTSYRTYREQNGKNHSTGEEEYFCRPDPATTRNIKPHNYAKLAPCGFVPENTFVEAGDVIVGRVMPQKQGCTMLHKDTSVALRSNEQGFVDRNCHGDRFFTNVTGEGYTFAKTRLRNERRPTIGDKVSSRHGQKGTVGMLYGREDLPFTAASGLVPDIIINPHAIPSRMTVAQLLEGNLGKACCARGAEHGDGTPFMPGMSFDAVGEQLEACGFERHGNELVYNPRSGELVPCAVYVQVVCYQRLKHMVADKVHCVTPEHEVLTRRRGWVAVADVSAGDEVATLAADGRTLEYARPLEVLAFPAPPALCDVVAAAAAAAPPLLRVTPEHRLWAEVAGPGQGHALVRAHLLAGARPHRGQRGAEAGLAAPAGAAAPAAHVELPCGLRLPASPAWLALVGARVAAAGAAGADARKTALRRAESLRGSCAPDLAARIDAALVGVGERGLPAWAWALDAAGARALLDGAAPAGAEAGTTRRRFAAAGRALADDLVRLALHAGLAPGGCDPRPEGGGWEAVLDDDSDDARPALAVAWADAACADVAPASRVHCLRVPSEVFLVRRVLDAATGARGPPLWTGNSRAANGPVVMLTRQPAEGRARDGGLRLGEMEIECLLGHGTPYFLKERMLECSDNYRVFVCGECCMMAGVNPERGIYFCKACKNVTNFKELRIPYACKLMLQEVQTMGIGARFLAQ